jgi:hypothetical protein
MKHMTQLTQITMTSSTFMLRDYNLHLIYHCQLFYYQMVRTKVFGVIILCNQNKWMGK